jgi:hypothetical protein
MRIMAFLPLLLVACSSGGNVLVANVGSDASPPAPPAADRCAHGGADEDCVDFLPAERMRGIWVSGFETSNFVPDATAPPRAGDAGWQAIWLDFARGAAPDRDLQLEAQRLGRAAVAIDFVGRRARIAGSYGHMGSARGLVIVDRIISIRILGRLPQ